MRRRAAERAQRTALRAAVLALAAVAAPGQHEQVVLDVAIAAAPHRTRLPALVWLCERGLPAVLDRPTPVDPRGPLRVTIAGGTVSVAALAQPLADGVVVQGACSSGEGPRALFTCSVDGIEDWFVPAGFVVPAPWSELLGELRALQPDVPRTVATAVLVGHLAGGLADGDPRAELLRLGASLCGDVTWLGWTAKGSTRVRGRSDGGLLLPAALVALAQQGGRACDGHGLRAYAARDAARTEAARQLVRGDDGALAPLRAMLHADDATRLAAIDALVRRGAAEELPAIVAAAAPDAPWATLGATEALALLWPAASPLARQRARAAIAASASMPMRALDPATWERPLAEAMPPAPGRVRTLAALALLALGVLGAWQRARARLRAAGTIVLD